MDLNGTTNTENGTYMNYTANGTSEESLPKLRKGAKEFFMIGLALTWLWTVLIISLNLAVIITICSYKKRSRLYFFLLNLAIADLACGLIDAFPHALERTVGVRYYIQVWLAGEIFCKIQRTVANTCIMTSNYLLAAMSMDRAYVICKPMMNIRRGNILQKAIVISCWVFCFACSSPLLKYYSIWYYHNYLPFVEKHFASCEIMFGTNVLKGLKIRIILMFVFMFVVPLVIITGSYILLVVSIYRRALKQTPSEKRAEKTERDRLTMSRVFNKGVPKSKVKSIKLTIGIVLSFFICWMAFFAGNFLGIFGGYNHPSFLILTSFYYWNSLANPILFFIYHRKKVRSASSPAWVSTETTQLRCTSTTEGMGISRKNTERL